MEVQQQNALFQYFSDTLAAVVQEAKKNGRYDMGILGKIGGLLLSGINNHFSDATGSQAGWMTGNGAMDGW